ncbi:MAG: nucleoside phosphorylase [Myxococcota bacterium]
MSEVRGQPITGLTPGQAGENVFLCGDPGRVERISRRWKDPVELANVREYRIVTGTQDGVQLTAASTGIGAPSTAILVEELAKTGVRTLIRVGNSGGLDPNLELGDLVITTGAVRDDGTSRSYVQPEFPAVAHHRVVAALEDAARERGVRFRTGITWSLDAFYARNATLNADGSLTSMAAGGYWTHGLEQRIRDMQQARVANCEMEAGALLTLASLFGQRAGAICVVSDRTPWPGPSEIDIDRNMEACIDVATRAMLSLARLDEE